MREEQITKRAEKEAARQEKEQREKEQRDQTCKGGNEVFQVRVVEPRRKFQQDV